MKEVTLSRIVALIKKLEDEHLEANNMLRIQFYDDVSGNFNYEVYTKEGGVRIEKLVDFGPIPEHRLIDLLEKYGV